MAADYNVTVFSSYKATIPNAEHVSLEWEDVVAIYAGEIAVTKDKAQVQYCVPCLLKEAPYVGLTAQRMAEHGLTVGKQRSASHVTEARLMVFDFDDLSGVEAKQVLGVVRCLGGQYLVYSSYSHGNPLKPGVRFRVVLGLDRVLDGVAYTSLWGGLNTQLFGGLADQTSRHMYQQQGKWASNPDWSHKAFRYVSHGEPLPCDRWIGSGGMTVINTASASVDLSAAKASRVRQALNWVDVTRYEHWQTVGSALKVLDPERFEQDWLAKSEPSDDPRYDPQRVWDSLKPHMPAEAAYAKLLSLARDGATAAVNKCRGMPQYTPEGQAAAMYLQQNHKRHWAELNRDN